MLQFVFYLACKYEKGPWSICNEETHEKSRLLTLKKGLTSVCNETMTITKPCKRRDAFTAAKISRKLIFIHL